MYGVRSLLAFWLGGASIPSTPAVPASPFSGRSGMALFSTSRFRKPRRWPSRNERRLKPARQ